MKTPRITPLLLYVSTAVMTLLACRPASYEIIRFGKDKKPDQAGSPNQMVPPDSQTDKPITTNYPPTARVEVILGGESVVRVRVGQPFEVRPSLDTVDPDDIGVSPCVNPGIIRADYDLAREATPSAARVQGCESLAVPYTFNRTGRFEITMEVTSNENEKAFASMILTVIGADEPLLGSDGGFTIKAVPMLPSKGEDVTFIGRCETPKANRITWSFGDGGTAEGRTVKHAYAQEGQYRVEAICTDADGQQMRATVTIVVIGTKILIPGVPVDTSDDAGDVDLSDLSDTGDGGSDQDGGDGRDPGQQPGQKPGQQPGQKPNQGLPSQTW